MGDEELIKLLRQKAEEEVKKYKELTHELNRLEMEQARAEIYLKQLNAFLVQEGFEPVPFPEGVK